MGSSSMFVMNRNHEVGLYTVGGGTSLRLSVDNGINLDATTLPVPEPASPSATTN